MPFEPLPIDEQLPALMHGLLQQRCAVLHAPPGAGKTTRVPLDLMSAAWLNGRRIVMLEPRRLAARAAAYRMAEELGEAVGQTVGYRVRMESRIGPSTRIEVVTEGVLTAMLQHDPALDGIGLVIFDEFHERNLQSDLGLALCRQAQQLFRDDLRVLIMSATMDVEAVAGLLGDCAVIRSSGRQFPVDVRYLAEPLPRGRAELPVAVATLIEHAVEQTAGGVLVFLPGVAEIRRVRESLAGRARLANADILPLYGDLPLDAQQQAIRPGVAGRRKIVLATTVAETSVTVEGITVVVDAGLTRVPRFDSRSGLTRLQTVKVSHASADQRCGRAGRLTPGVCWRMWTTAEQRGLVPQNRPEILEADLAPLVLELARWGAAADELVWMDPPPPAALTQAEELLQALGALAPDRNITDHGRRMGELGVHPRLAHMMLRGREQGNADAACALAALLSERDVFQKQDVYDSDLLARLDCLRESDCRGTHVNMSALQRARRLARQWYELLERFPSDDAAGGGDTPTAAALLGLAYPDRIAQRRTAGVGRFVMANGKGIVVPDDDPLAAADFIVAATIGGGGPEPRVFLGAALARRELEQTFSDLIRRVDVVEWDGVELAVRARRQRRLGALLLDDEPLSTPDPDRVRNLLLEGIRAAGVARLPWDDALRQWQARVGFVRRLHNDVDAGGWPDVSDPALERAIADWLGPFLDGKTRASALTTAELRHALHGMLTHAQRQELETLAPDHYTVPSGSRIRIDYCAGEVPVMAVRLQEMYGSTQHPRVGGGAGNAAGEPVLLHLLSPAMRPVQMTRDLPGFWAGAYRDVRKELRGRYPKHYWPEDPVTAEPVRGVRRKR